MKWKGRPKRGRWCKIQWYVVGGCTYLSENYPGDQVKCMLGIRTQNIKVECEEEEDFRILNGCNLEFLAYHHFLYIKLFFKKSAYTN